MQLKNKVAIVTGGGGGLGEGICLSLAQQGAHVIVSDLNANLANNVSKKIEEIGSRSLALKTDVCSTQECQDLVEGSINQFGKVDILVCCAGENGFSLSSDYGLPTSIESLSEEQWNLTIDVNLKGTFLCNKAIFPYFKKQKKGKIINISSIGGRKGVDFIPHYCAAKAGVIVFTQAIALQLAPYNINVNCICPGLIWTPLWKHAAEALSKIYPHFENTSPEKIFEITVSNMIPLQRPQFPEDIGNAVTFLASSSADQITGQTINVDGGAVFN